MALIHYYSKHPVAPVHVHRLTIRAAVPKIPAVQSGLGNFARMHIAPQAPPAPEHVAPKQKPVRIPPKKHAVVAAKPRPRPSPKPKPRSVVDRNATVHGSALWWSGVSRQRKWRRDIYRVDFLVDGRVLYTDHTWPFSFHRHDGWDTRTVANGRHMLVMRAFGTHHYRARKSIPVRVDNASMQLDVVGAPDGSAVAGEARIGVTANEPLDRVALYVDGRPVSRDASKPYDLLWDTRLDSEGTHEIVVYARGRGGRRAAQSFEVVVANAKDFPQALTRDWASDAGAPSSDVAQSLGR